MRNVRPNPGMHERRDASLGLSLWGSGPVDVKPDICSRRFQLAAPGFRGSLGCRMESQIKRDNAIGGFAVAPSQHGCQLPIWEDLQILGHAPTLRTRSDARYDVMPRP